MGIGNPATDAEAKKNLKTLTRTDFLLQFIWQPPKPEDQPKTDEERDAKIKEIIAKVTEAEKNNPAVTMPKVEELTKASLKKTQELDSKIQNAIAPAAPGGAGTPGFGAPPAGTGTPPGVGLGHKPDAIFLRPGDEMHLGIERLGEQRQKVVAWRHRGDEVLP